MRRRVLDANISKSFAKILLKKAINSSKSLLREQLKIVCPELGNVISIWNAVDEIGALAP